VGNPEISRRGGRLKVGADRAASERKGYEETHHRALRGAAESIKGY
jgi:hypothetical protein